MCAPAIPLALGVAAASSAVGAGMAIKSSRDAKKASNAQAASIERAEADRKAAADKAAQDAALARADTRRRMRSQSLLSTGAQGTGSMLTSYGKDTLGG
jgi:hypothetical protein